MHISTYIIKKMNKENEKKIKNINKEIIKRVMSSFKGTLEINFLAGNIMKLKETKCIKIE